MSLVVRVDADVNSGVSVYYRDGTDPALQREELSLAEPLSSDCLEAQAAGIIASSKILSMKDEPFVVAALQELLVLRSHHSGSSCTAGDIDVTQTWESPHCSSGLVANEHRGLEACILCPGCGGRIEQNAWSCLNCRQTLELQVFVRTMGGERFGPLLVGGTTTLASLGKAVAQLTGVSPQEQRLLAGVQLLERHSLLAQLHSLCIAGDAELQLVLLRSWPARLAVRCRPLAEREVGDALDAEQVVVDSSAASVILCGGLEAEQAFAADFVFDEDASQSQVYDAAIADLVAEAVLDHSGLLVLVYGASRSGRTFTSLGELAGDRQGILPRLFGQVMTEVQRPSFRRFCVTASFADVYNSETADLLAPEDGRQLAPLRVRDDPQIGPFLQGLSQHVVNSAADLVALLEQGRRRFLTNCTNMERSSADSSLVFSLWLWSVGDDAAMLNFTKLTVVDCAASPFPKCGRSGPMPQRPNREIIALHRVVDALQLEAGESPRHVPYRDGVMTRLLCDGLGGIDRLAVVATCCLSRAQREQSLATLQFAARARKVRSNHAAPRSCSRADACAVLCGVGPEGPVHAWQQQLCEALDQFIAV